MIKKSIYYLFIFFGLLTSCTEKDYEDKASGYLEENLEVGQDANFIDPNEVQNIATAIFKNNNKIFSKGGLKKSISEIKPIGSNVNKPSYYIINYNGGGFLIMSGDNRAMPVLAFSNEDHFDTSADSYPSLLIEWLESQDKYIKEIRKNSLNDKLILVPEDEWNIKNIENYISSNMNSTNKPQSVNESGTGSLTFQYGPLLSTSWGQGVGYNDLAPNNGCSNYSNGRTPTGCVATAMSQIMKYYQYPSNYNWTQMYDGSGSNETARLMLDAGNSVGMDWGCSGSSAETSSVPNALKSTFGYSAADYMDFSIATTKSELNAGYPVILRGGEKATKWLIFNVYENGHAWICDGIRQYSVPVRVSAGLHGYITVFHNAWTYHMNWGWSGMYNGWYSASWQVGSDTFTYKAGMVYNIRK